MKHSAAYKQLAKASDLPLSRGYNPRLQHAKTAILSIVAVVLAATASCDFATAQTAGIYQVTNIISDGFVPATTMDPNFIDPWGVSGQQYTMDQYGRDGVQLPHIRCRSPRLIQGNHSFRLGYGHGLAQRHSPKYDDRVRSRTGRRHRFFSQRWTVPSRAGTERSPPAATML